jgi:carboxyl-terminal processing protease
MMLPNSKQSAYFVVALLFFSGLWSCQKDEEVLPDKPADPITRPSTNQSLLKVKEWIKEEMDVFYFWNEEMPDLLPSSVREPEDYFYRLLYKDDRFSWITDDAEKLMQEMEGIIASQGFSPSFGHFNNSNGIFIIVEYVYKGSPAEKAGLKRGDIILAINDQPLTRENYQRLYNQDAYTVTLGEYTNSGIRKTNVKLSLSSMALEMNPVLHWEVKEYEGKKVGYLVYAEFISGPNDRWLNELGTALTEIKKAGATELILDLRYNSGGEVYAAGYLASAIAPKSVIDSRQVFVRFDYNKTLQGYFTEKEGQNSRNLLFRFPRNPLNLDLERVVFLTGQGTASASELLIKGLDPYMNVVTIGEKTVGKFYGSIVINDENKPPAHNYAIMPLILKYQNAHGFTDFIDGLVPNYNIEDDLMNAKPFGDIDDPIFAKAVEVLTGKSTRAARMRPSVPYNKLRNEEKLRRGNILIPDKRDFDQIILQ